MQISSMCTVFAESEVISLLAQGVEREKLSPASTVRWPRVAAMAERLGKGELILFTGGVAKMRELGNICPGNWGGKPL